MTWIKVGRRQLDGYSSIIHGNNGGASSNNSRHRTTIISNNTRRNNNSSCGTYCKKKRRRSESTDELSIGRELGSGNDIAIHQTSFPNEKTKELCTSNSRRPNILDCEESGSCTGCTTATNRENNVPTLKENGNDYVRSQIFRDAATTTPTTSTSKTILAGSGSIVFKQNSKGCNQLFPPLSSSFSSSSAESTSSSSSSSSTPGPSSTTSWFLFFLVFSWNLSSTSSFCPPSCSCDDIALSVDCHSASNLKVVPIFLNPQIRFLSLSKNQIKDITMSLQFYSELHVLDISHNKLESLGKTNFESLKSLHLLNVSYNSIKTLENGVFTGLTHLKIVDLSGNQLDRVEREIFSSLAHIKEIILDRNRLEFLDWDLFRGLDTLERISAKFNFIQVIEPSPTFSSASIDAQSMAIYKNNVNLNGSASSLVGSAGGGIPGWTLGNVRYLDMSSNQLTRVKDYGLVIFGALKELNLCCNYIHTLEENAFLISPSSTTLGQVERVNLSQNRLGRVPTEALEKLGSTLRHLDLSSNRISDHIPKNAFRGLVHLESVQISDNPEILYVDPDALSENINMINFEADYLSNLTEISPTLLKNKMFLENFSVKYASIASLSPDFFQSPVSDIVGCLDLTGNPIDCNCSAHTFYQFVTDNLGASVSPSVFSADSPYHFDPSLLKENAFHDENNNLIRENTLRSNSNHDRVDGKSNSSSHPSSELSSHSNPNLITHHQPTSTQSRSSSSLSNKRNSNKNLSNTASTTGNTRTNLLYVRCQSPSNLAGVLMKDLKPSDFQHCFTDDDQFQIMVICIAAAILSLIFLTLAIKLCCVCGVFSRLSSFCKTHCSPANCCQLKSQKEKQSSDKLFFDSMTIALRRDLAPVAPPPNFNTNIPNGKSILGEHPTSQLLYCGNGTGIPFTSGCAIEGGSNGGVGIGSGTLGRNGNGNHQITMSMDYDDCYHDEDEDDDDDDDDEEETHQHQHPPPRTPQHRNQVYGHRDQLERCYAPIEPPPPIPIPLQFPNQVQSLSRKQQQKHQQLLLHHGHQHHSPTMGYSPKHYSHRHQHSSPKHSQQQQHNPPVIVHYEYADFPSMHRVKQVPSVLV